MPVSLREGAWLLFSALAKPFNSYKSCTVRKQRNHWYGFSCCSPLQEPFNGSVWNRALDCFPLDRARSRKPWREAEMLNMLRKGWGGVGWGRGLLLAVKVLD